MKFFKLYLLSLVIFFIIDLFWLGVLAKDLYKEQLGYIMAPHIRWGAALVFYFLYIGGLTLFVVYPLSQDGNWILPLLYGGFFGLVCYATYDLTNFATLKGWPLKIVIYDLLWGTFISGVTSFIACYIGNIWKQVF